MSFQNQAVLHAEVGDKGKVTSVPISHAGPGQLLIKNHAVAINPVDWKMRDSGWRVGSWPTIYGVDLAGEVAEVGADVTSFKVGQRVIAHPMSIRSQDATESAFQHYTIVMAKATAALPDHISYEDACVLPLSISTAAHGLYSKDHLDLPLPSQEAKTSGKTILVWGGSGSVGAATVQLARASGLEVISTASPKNFDFVKSLGATEVLDYNDVSVTVDLVALLKTKDLVAAYDGIGSPESASAIADVVSKLGGGKITSALDVGEAPNVVATHVMAPSIFFPPDGAVGTAIWEHFLPQALQTGQIKPAPPAKVVGDGLKAIPAAMDQMKDGVSATKLVVTL